MRGVDPDSGDLTEPCPHLTSPAKIDLSVCALICTRMAL